MRTVKPKSLLVCSPACWLLLFTAALLLCGCPGKGNQAPAGGSDSAGDFNSGKPAPPADSDSDDAKPADAPGAADGQGSSLPGADVFAEAEKSPAAAAEKSFGDPMQPTDEQARRRLEALGYLTGSSGSYKLERAMQIVDELAEAGDPYSIMYRAVIRRYHYKETDYELPADFVEKSLNTMSSLADAGEPEAQYIVARYMYTFRYPDTAHVFYRYARESADSGFEPAAGYLGYLYTTTLREGPHYEEAAKWLSSAAEDGQADAMYHLGYLYGQPQWSRRDPKLAVEWFTRSAEREYPFAYWALGWCHESGTGTPQNLAQAAEWYEKGAAANNGESLYSLGLLYAQGRGVARDLEKARDLFERALNAGEQRAQKELDSLGGKA